ncbi:MAG TPA: hypothetical protein PLW24_01985 [Burkholderiaceae bacterium]|nr:hypothetical protein [Burkholderiaceae bacterium]HNB42712.1 hypothetical protein [Burkholderiaceae bacterium]HNG78212.1 hypothetical protein [Burkholderiaceae bacterium]
MDSPFALGFVNHVDTATVTGVGWEADAPPSSLVTYDLADTARSIDATAANTIIDIDFGSAKSVRLLYAQATNYSATATHRLQLGTTNGGSDVADSGAIDAWRFTPWQYDGRVWGSYILLPATYSARYARYRIVDESNADGYVELGRLSLCDAWFIPYGPEGGLADGHADRSSTILNESGSEQSTRRVRPRTVTLTVPYLTLDEGDYLHQVDQFLGTTDEVVYLPHTDNPARCQQYAMACRMTELTPLQFPRWGMRAKAFNLTQRR